MNFSTALVVSPGLVYLLVFLPALLNAFLILWAVTTRDVAKKPPGAMKKWAQWVVYGEAILAGFGLVFLLLKLTIARSDLLLGEPLSLGISIWPSVMIRLLAFLVAVVLLSLASYSFVVYGSPQEDNLKNALPENVKFRWRKWMWGLWGRSGDVSRDELFEKLFAANPEETTNRHRLIGLSGFFLRSFCSVAADCSRPRWASLVN